MKEKIKVIAKLVFKNKKQILFALFAILTFILDKDSSVLLNAAPLVVAGAKAAGGAAASAASSASAASAASAAGGAASASTSASIGTSAAKTSSAAASANAAKASAGANVTGTSSIKPSYLSNTGANVQKNINPSSSIDSHPLSNSSTPMQNDITKEELKDSSKSLREKEKNAAKNTRLDNSINSAKNDDDEVDVDIENNNATKILKKDASNTIFGCFVVCFLILVFCVPILVMLFIYPTDSTVSQLNCSTINSEACEKISDSSGNDSSFFQKLKNLLKYGTYGTNMDVFLNKIEQINSDVFLETNLYMNIPLFISTIVMDSENLYTSIDNTSTPTITDDMLDRLDYGFDLAMKQFILIITYECDGEVYDHEEGDNCRIIKYYVYDEAGYYNRLKEDMTLLTNLFKDFDVNTSIDLIFSKMQNQYKVYNNIRDREHNEVSAGNVPSDILYDSNVNLESPLKGSYSITSPYGERTGQFAGNHNGIDLVANDKQIYSAGNGVVVRTYTEKEGGNIIEIRHTTGDGSTYISQYAHLSQILVSPGDTISTGTVIGIMGDTGITSGVHLHFAIWNEQTNERYNPKNIFIEATNYNSI